MRFYEFPAGVRNFKPLFVLSRFEVFRKFRNLGKLFISTDAFVLVSFIVLRVSMNHSEVYSYLNLPVIPASLAPREK